MRKKESADDGDASDAFEFMKPTILYGDCRDTLPTMSADSVHCCVTSPPYWCLRSYLPKGHEHKHLEIGSEPTPEAFVETMVQVFREVRRVLHPSGTCWLNLGDSYAVSWGNYGGKNRGNGKQREIINGSQVENPAYDDREDEIPANARVRGLKEKDLCMIPWRVDRKSTRLNSSH